MYSRVQSCLEGGGKKPICSHGCSSVLNEGERTKYVLMGAVLF